MSTEEIEIVAEETPESEPASAPASTANGGPTSLAELTPKTKLTGKVKRLELYGASIDLGFEATALVHISKMGNEQVNRVSDVLNVGDEVTVWVEKVDPERGQVMLTMVEPLAVDWSDLQPDQVYEGTVSRLENFGAFVNIGAEREGLVHISELSHDYVKHPGDVVRVGDPVKVKVLGFNRRKRRIDLSMKALMEKPEGEDMPEARAQSSGARSQGGGTRPQGGGSRPSGGQRPAGGGQRSSGSGKRSGGRREQNEDWEQFVDDEAEEVPTAMEIALRRALGNEAISEVKAQERPARSKKQRSADQRRMQEELLNRTLQLQGEN
jgi:transcriptional accessory protein Tex/SPT6